MMALSIVSIIPQGNPSSLPFASASAEKATALVAQASEVEVWPLVGGLFDIRYVDGASEVQLNPRPPGAAILIVGFEGSDEADYARVWADASNLHAELGSVGTAVCDKRVHRERGALEGQTDAVAIALAQRHRSLDRDAYMHHYLNTHVPLAKALKPLLVIRYRTFRVLQHLGTFDADSLTTQEFGSRADLDAFFAARFEDPNDEASLDAARFLSGVLYSLGRQPQAG